MMLFKLAWRNIWRNKKRSMITIVSIVIAVFLSVFMRSMQLGSYSNMISNVVGSFSGYLQVHVNGYWDEKNIDNSLVADDKLIESIKSVEGVGQILQRLQNFSLASKGELTKGVIINGVELEKENLLVDWNTRLIAGRLFNNGDDQVILGKGVAEFFKLNVGDTIVFIGQGYHGMSAAGKFSVCGIVNMKNPKINNISVFMPLPAMRTYTSADEIVTHLIIDKNENSDEEEILQKLQSSIDTSQYEIMTWGEMLPELQQTIMADSVGGLIMVFILYMIITFGIFGTVLMMTQERIYEFGVMVSIGMKKSKLSLAIILETIMLTSIGVIIGIFSVMPLAYYFNANPINIGGDQKEALEKFGFEAVIPLSTNPDIPLTHGLIIAVISLIVAIYPTIVINTIDPVKAMRR